MSNLKLKQGQGFRGIYALFEYDKTTPINIGDREVVIKVVNVERDKVELTLSGDDVTITDNTAIFTVTETQTIKFMGTYKIQIIVNGIDLTDKIVSLTPVILEFSKTY